MRGDELPKSVRERMYAERHRLLDDDLGQSVRRILDAGINDAFSSELLSHRVIKHRIARAFQGEFAIPDLDGGDLVLGLDQRGQSLCCPMQMLNAHVLTLGGSGSGKTTKSRFMALQMIPRLPGAWLFDLRKREFAVLRSFLLRVGVDLIVVPARLLRLNPFQVPLGVVPMDWAACVADMLVTALGLPPRASKLLLVAIVRLYERRGVLRGSRDYPTLFDLREDVAGDRDANVPAKQAIVDSLDPLMLSLGAVFRYRIGWSPHDLARRRIVFELGGVPEAAKNLILNTLLLSEFLSRVARGVSNPAMDLWICCDEAARLVSASNPSGGISDLIGLIRGTGAGLDLSVQGADIAPAILSNTATKIIGRCGSATDYDTMSAAMGLTDAQRAWLRAHLVPGLFVGQLGEGSWREPFVFQIPPMRLVPQGETPNMGDLLRLPSEPSSGP